MTMIEKGKEYYLVSNDYDWIKPMKKVKVLLADGDKEVYVRHAGPWPVHSEEKVYGYVKPHELMTINQILKLRDDHLEMMDAIERHG